MEDHKRLNMFRAYKAIRPNLPDWMIWHGVNEVLKEEKLKKAPILKMTPKRKTKPKLI